LAGGGPRPGIDNSLPGAVNRPGVGGRPGIDNSLPGAINRPGIDNSLPGVGNRPGVGGRPGIDNSLPGAGNRPGLGNQPGIGDGPGIANRPGFGGRPSPGDLGDFLGMDQPLRPDGNLPTRPGQGGGRIQDQYPLRPDNRPLGPNNRPGQVGDNFVNRPIDIGNDFNFNTNINYRPQWANINNNALNGVRSNWQSALGGAAVAGGLYNWGANHPDRVGYWNGWGNNIRDQWPGFYHNDCFGPDWWQSHNHAFSGWHYGYAFANHDWSYWWSQPTWPDFSNWFTWSAPATAWSEPIYYDYGEGGNVVYQDNSVYIDGQQIATADEFAQSAAALATVAPPASEEEAAQAEWMPLGAFAVSTNQKETEPPYAIQLAVSKEGIVSGTFYHTQNDQAYTVQGQVDKETQRVAFRIGGSDAFVAETGLYNLTQDEAPLLVHFGPDKTETWLLVRMEQPQDGAGE
jgi:hypothetical protein